jgi:uncharacterized protein (TIGR00255 family)
MISMTGYGRASAVFDSYEVSVEVSSVNKRNLDVSVSLPREWKDLEIGVAERVRGYCRRGKVYLSVQVDRRDESGKIAWDESAVSSVLSRLRDLAERHDVSFVPDADLLYRVARDCSDSGSLPGAEIFRERLNGALDQALEAWSEMRRKEGVTLAADMKKRALQIQEWIREIKGLAEETVPAYRELLFRRLRQAALELDLDDERVLKEVALFADRCDIAEEVTRLMSHLDQLELLLRETNEAVGRKTDFLLQEINREINTIGSKASDIRVSRRVIDCKNELERIREQLQNVE